jgi:hypothetical protein
VAAKVSVVVGNDVVLHHGKEKKMSNLKVLVVSLLLVLAMGMPVAGFAQTADPNDRFKLNAEAYGGIHFSDIFSNSPGIGLGQFFDQIRTNLGHAYGAIPAAGTAGGDVIALLDDLLAFLNGPSGSAPGGLKGWRVRSFFMDNLQVKYAGNADVETLFTKHFNPLEVAGLTLPWLMVAADDRNPEVRNLVYNTRFLEVLGRLSLPDFFLIPTDPLMDEDTLTLSEQVVQYGMLGSLHRYALSNTATVSIAALAKDGYEARANSCCYKPTYTCIPADSGTCAMCGSRCCLGSTTCP